MPRKPPPAAAPAETFEGFGALAEHLGVAVEDVLPADAGPVPEDAVARLRRLRDQAASPDDYPSLREHRVEQNGQAAGVPEAAAAAARDAADGSFGGRGQARRGRGGRRGGPKRDPAAVAARRTDAALDLLEALDIPDDVYAVDGPDLRLRVPAGDAAGYPPLPAGYGFKGGVARKALARLLRLPLSTAAVRDIDLCRLAGADPEPARELAERYMTDDVIHGNADVEVIESTDAYLNTREFTVNELLFVDGEVRATPLALLDTVGQVVRVTQAHLNRSRGRTHPIVGYKALRFAANREAEGGVAHLRPFRLDFRPRAHPLAFFFALQLSRACEASTDIACRYVDLTRAKNLLHPVGLNDDVAPAEAARLLRERLPGYHLVFPGLLDEPAGRSGGGASA